jgi:hypothetical protein
MTACGLICAAMQESHFQRRSHPVEEDMELLYAATQCRVEPKASEVYVELGRRILKRDLFRDWQAEKRSARLKRSRHVPGG